MKVNSFDIFDTIISRQCKNPSDIFDIIENEYPYKNFKELRIQAERMAYEKYKIKMNIDHIYLFFKELSNDDVDKLKKYEIQKEIEYSIPILSNIRKIKKGDIYISDMYLKPAQIIRLLSLHKIPPNRLIVTSGGKADGTVYKTVHKYIDIHTGDNYHSDILMANKYNINAFHTTLSSFTSTENLLYDLGYIEFQKSIRKYRLENPYPERTNEYELYHQQITYNIPVLILFSIEIKKILDTENLNKVLFLTRDCCLLHKIFHALYPDIEIMEYASSRIVHKSPSVGYIDYMKQHYTDKSILIDLHGSFKSGRKLYLDTFGKYPRVHLFIFFNDDVLFDGLTYSLHKNISTHIKSDYIEMLNYDRKGTLIDVVNNIELRAHNENNDDYVKISHDTVLNYLKYIKDIPLNMDTTMMKKIYLNLFKDKNKLSIHKNPLSLKGL